jgi:hypothetical protein
MDREITISAFKQRLEKALHGQALPIVARETRNKVQLWYTKLPQDWFDSTEETFPDGTPRHGGVRTFMQPLKSSWQYETDDSGFSVFFKHNRTGNGSSSNWGLRLQQYGGTITPKNKKALTIPVTAEARGMRASTFEKKYNRNLFVVGKNREQGEGTLAWEDEAGKLHAAFVLRKKSVVKSLRERRGHDAIPSEKELADWATENFIHYINFVLNNG